MIKFDDKSENKMKVKPIKFKTFLTTFNFSFWQTLGSIPTSKQIINLSLSAVDISKLLSISQRNFYKTKNNQFHLYKLFIRYPQQ